MPPFKTKRLTTKPIPSAPLKKTAEKLEKKDFFPPLILRQKKIWFIVMALIFSSALVSKAYIEATKSNKINGSENVELPLIAEMFETKKVEGTVNILIAGIGGKGHDGSDLTDSIMLASLDGENKRVTLLSIPRDLYVSYPENRGAGRINALYDIGKRDKKGIQYLAEKVSEITGQTIDKYFVIDFSGFKKIIDTLGGIMIDVPEKLVDVEYPDNNWGYETFFVEKGLQNFDGETALKYARSRHSTSDFDRSERQQLIIKAVKEKATGLGIITDTDKLSEILKILEGHLDTDMSLIDFGKIALSFSDVENENISIVNLSDICLSLTKCQAGSYLYTPSRDLFGGSSVVIPENAQANRLSYYKDIRNFVDVTFRFPGLRNEPRDIVIVYGPKMKTRAQEIGYGLAKLGFPLSFEKTLLASSGSIEKSHVNIYWHEDLMAGINPERASIQALKYIEESLPYTLVTRNEYINTSGPKIEIVVGNDANLYFKNFKNPYYIPSPPKPTASGEQTGSLLMREGSGSKKSTDTKKTLKSISGEKPADLTGWENF